MDPNSPQYEPRRTPPPPPPPGGGFVHTAAADSHLHPYYSSSHEAAAAATSSPQQQMMMMAQAGNSPYITGGYATSPVGGGGDGYYDGDHHHYETMMTEQQQQEELHSWQQAATSPSTATTTTTAEPGSYYEARPPLQLQLFAGGSGAIPVGAVAFDKTYDAIYATTVSSSAGAGSGRSGNKRLAMGRSSTMQVHSPEDGMLYSSVSCHPEAPSSVLKAVYQCMYGSGIPPAAALASTTAASPARGGRSVLVPHHAYQPPYGKADPALPDLLNSNIIGGSHNNDNYQMGVTALLPLEAGAGGGHVASVSPAGVRVHATGGLQVFDQSLHGMLSLTPHPRSQQTQQTHLTVGGMAVAATTRKGGDNKEQQQQQHSYDQHVHCLDIWQGLRIVSSHNLDRHSSNNAGEVAVTSMATSHSRGCVAAGCSDGYLRLIDDRNRDLAKIKSHMGGVVGVAVSDDGNLVATTGYGSMPSAAQQRSPGGAPLYGYPDPTVLINDIRYLGRGGFPHPFAGLRGGPRHLSFLPELLDGQHEISKQHRLLVASGQAGGGCQILVPFQETSTHFLSPNLGRGESISSLCVSEDNLALGTSQGKILQYRMAGYTPSAQSSASFSSVTSPFGSTARNGTFVPGPSSNSSRNAARQSAFVVEKQPLKMPSYQPPVPPLSLEASLLLNEDPTTRLGMTDRVKSVFGTYTLVADPTVSIIGDSRERSLTSFGPLEAMPMVHQCRLQVSSDLLKKATHLDFIHTVPVSELGVNIFEDHRPTRIKERDRKQSEPLRNPNKLIYAQDLFKVAYEDSFNRTKRYGRHSRGSTVAGDATDEESHLVNIPNRYRLILRPSHKSAATFSHAEFNQTDIIPGYDYPMTMPNAFVPPVLLLLYCIPEVREAALKAQIGRHLSSMRGQAMVSELGNLFHRMDTLANCGFLFPADDGATANAKVEAWAPSSFISCLSTMPEAERFQILDGSPAAVDTPRRPEAFYRFLLYQFDKEMDRDGSTSGLIDSLLGINFVSINEFISGSCPPSDSSTRQLTVDLNYDYFRGPEYATDKKPCFGDVLQHNLCRAVRLRAWSQGSKSYETIVQRKIVTTLPEILSLSAACAGKRDEEGLGLWRNEYGENNHWLPEMVEVEIKDDGFVVVRERVHDEETGSDTWRECTGPGSIPSSISEVVMKSTSSDGPRKRRYRLESVISLIRDDYDRSCPEEVRALNEEGPTGHHVVHVRVPKSMKKQILVEQHNKLEKYLLDKEVESVTEMTLMGRTTRKELLQERLVHVQKSIEAIDEKDPKESEWILANGFVVSDAVVEDARAFHVKFKEPSLVIFRAVDDWANKTQLSGDGTTADSQIPAEIIRSASLTNSSKSLYAANQRPANLPGKGDLVAFDAEFVAVEEEQSTLTLAGSKVTIRETRHALARISVIAGRPDSAGNVVFDDHVQPNEEVTDYLTRFSGIVAQDLSPKQSQHHLISARTAYLKLRCMVERGCIFVGHGLQQDFWTANLAVPANQIIDTVEIYHKPSQRYISLRFLCNFVLRRDMQQDVHDSVEDALAAFELYRKAIALKRTGEFDKLLNELYEFGQRTDWKLGVDEGD